MQESVSRLDVASRWGLLPVAIVLAFIVAVRVGAIVFNEGPPHERALFGGVAATAIVVLGVRVLGAFGGLTQDVLFGALFVVGALLLIAYRERQLELSWRGLVSIETAPLAALATVAIGIAAATAYLLPVWQWDALGYHLPYVNFALQRGTLADVPRDVPYLSTYPHGIELFFVGWRAMLPDDRLVDAAHIPLGLVGAGAVGVLARQLGARRDHAVAAGLSWLTLPAVFLQLPTNYIDVASSAFLLAAAALALGEPNVRNTLGASLALGLFLGSKPNAPVGTALVFALIAVRGWKAGLRGSLAAAAACVLLVGSESYVVNILDHGNPIWPVRVHLGPWSLPGTLPMNALLDSGAAAPRVHGPLVSRVFRSWTSLDAPPVFDMRYGGLGALFLAALPVALVVAIKRRSLAIALIAVAALASPDPAVARYVLAFPGLVLAIAASRVSLLGLKARQAIFGASAVAACFGLVRAYPGLTGEGPPLSAYVSMTEAERLRAVGADGSPRRFFDALDRIGPEDSTAFDASFDLPYLAWPPDLSRRAIRIPDHAGTADALRIVDDPHVRLLVVDAASPVAEAARAQGVQFAELFHCKSSSCVVFLRL